MARSTPYSCVRSRTPMATVLPKISTMMARITSETTSTAPSTAEIMPMNDVFIARSLMLNV